MAGAGAASAVTADTVARARGGTLYIRARGLNRQSIGTGVLIDAHRGLVLTNFHVIALADDVQAGTPDRLDDASIQAAAPCEDLALLKVQGVEGRTPIALGRQGEVKQGDPVVALGYPVSASGGTSLTSTAGVVSSVRTRCGSGRPRSRATPTSCRPTPRSPPGTPAVRSLAPTAGSWA